MDGEGVPTARTLEPLTLRVLIAPLQGAADGNLFLEPLRELGRKRDGSSLPTLALREDPAGGGGSA